MFSSLSKMWQGSTDSDDASRNQTTPKRTRSTLVDSRRLKARVFNPVAAMLLFAATTDGAAESELQPDTAKPSSGVCSVFPHIHRNQRFKYFCTSCLKPDRDGSYSKTRCMSRMMIEDLDHFYGLKAPTSQKNKYKFDKPRWFVMNTNINGEPILWYQEKRPRMIGHPGSYKLETPIGIKPKGLIRRVLTIKFEGEKKEREDYKEGIISITGEVCRFKSKIKQEGVYDLREEGVRTLRFKVRFNGFTCQSLLVRLSLHFKGALDPQTRNLLKSISAQEEKGVWKCFANGWNSLTRISPLDGRSEVLYQDRMTEKVYTLDELEAGLNDDPDNKFGEILNLISRESGSTSRRRLISSLEAITCSERRDNP